MDLSLPRGIRDIEPEEYALHARVRDAFEEVARIYNFKAMEPASIEHLLTLRAKSGEDVDKEIYSFKDKGGRDVGLRFDLTVGITRYVCSRKDLKLPVKVGAFGGMWRYDEPQYGRYRWSHQWDLEVFGPSSVESDAEIIDASAAILKRLGIDSARVKVGDRRVVESYIKTQVGIDSPTRVFDLMRALDKVEKKSRLELEQEYEAKGFSKADLGRVLDLGDLNGKPEKVLERAAEMHLEGTEDLTRLLDDLRSRGVVNLEYNMRIVRGIDYYTGIVFEAVDEKNPRLGSLFGGGRYDALPRIFGRPDLSATGAAGGVERESMSISKADNAGALDAFVASATADSRADASALLARIRSDGFSGDMSPRGRSLGKQLEEASSRGARWVLIVGKEEIAAGTVTLRNMASRSEERLPKDDAIRRLAHS